MQSGKSFFNAAIYKKTLLRCWPIWLIYIGIWTAAMPLNIINRLEQGRFLRVQLTVLELATQAGPFVAFFACIGVAMAVFGGLYNTKSVNFAASLPVSRTAHYCTSIAAGMTILLGSNVVVFLLTALVESVYGGLDMATLWQWLGWTCLLDVHFFGFAACCAMLTGHILILPAVYAIFQLAAVVIQGTVAYILEHMVWGLDYGQWDLIFLSPIAFLTSVYPANVSDPVTGETLSYFLGQWPVVLLYAGAGILLAVLGWRLFQRRRMEAATDVVAIAILKPVFRWCLAFAGSLGFGGGLATLVLASRSGGGNMTDALLILLTMAIGGLVGWFLADILMRKTIRVFRLHWKGAVLYTALLSLFLLGAELDVTGYEKRLPHREDIGRVYISCSEGSVELVEPENIELVLALQESVIQNRDLHEQHQPEDSWYTHLYISYSGAVDEAGFAETIMNRRYEILITDELAEDPNSDVMLLERLINTKEAIADRKATRLPVTEETIYNAMVFTENNYEEDEPFHLELTAEEACELYTDCLLPDMAEGTLGRVWIVTDEEYEKTVYDLRIHLDLQQPRPDWVGTHMEYAVAVTREAPPSYEQLKDIPYEYDSFYTVPTVDSWRTNAWLEYHGVPMETLWEVYNRAE